MHPHSCLPIIYLNRFIFRCIYCHVVECDEDMYDETFIHSQSPKLQINNIKFIQSASNSWLLVIENGKAILSDCEFHCTSNAIMVKEGAELVMQNCKVQGALVSLIN